MKINYIDDWRLNDNRSLSGFIHNDNRFPDNSYITTTPIQSISDDNWTVITRSGTKYNLGVSETHCQADIRELLE